MIAKVDCEKYEDLKRIKNIFLQNNPEEIVPIIDKLCKTFDEKI